MPSTLRPITLATRGSALALAQAKAVFDQCRKAFPKLTFEIKIIKTTGDRLQRASLTKPNPGLPKGLFTKELEVALLKHHADLAIHSLKDLPTQLPAGLALGAVGKRGDIRDVLIYRDADHLNQIRTDPSLRDWSPGQSERRGFCPNLHLSEFPPGTTLATSSTRRLAQLQALRPDFRFVEIRGNVVTRLQKLGERSEFDGIILALAGLERLDFRITPQGQLIGDAVPDGLLATILPPEVMLPCVGQGAIGIEIRNEDSRIAAVCERLNHYNSFQCVAAERAFLRTLGGGCQSPIGAYAEVSGTQIHLRAVSFREEPMGRRVEGRRPLAEAVALGEDLAKRLSGGPAPVG